MNEFKEEMKRRTMQVAVAIMKECDKLPKSGNYSVINKQLARCSTSIGANYRAACRAKSGPDFISKMQTVEEECDESIYWIEIILDLLEVPNSNFTSIKKELNEILSIVVKAIKTTKGIKTD